MSIESQGDNVAIVVADTGRGIPAEHVQLVFERFHRVDPSRDRASGGMGLGLAVVRQLVTAMNGRVWVESEVGRGSRFGVELPASPIAGAA
jgi:signal transduction histidine kinase